MALYISIFIYKYINGFDKVNVYLCKLPLCDFYHCVSYLPPISHFSYKINGCKPGLRVFCFPQSIREDVKMAVQRQASKTIPFSRCLEYTDRLKALNIFSFERCFKGD